MKQPWPGIARTIYGDHERFERVYFSKFPGYYTTGDGELLISCIHVFVQISLVAYGLGKKNPETLT